MTVPSPHSAEQQSTPVTQPLLKVEQLVKHFPVRAGLFQRTVDRVHAVDGVSFEIQAGETLGLVGESGCGKSTTGRCILRLIEPTSGQVWFAGRNVTTLDKHALRAMARDMQIIFQDPFASLNPRMTVGTNSLRPDPTTTTVSCSCCKRWAWIRTICAAIRMNSPADNASASASRERWRWTPS